MLTPKVVINISHHPILHFLYVQWIVNYSVLTQGVPRINLIKISHSQVNIIIIFITFLSGCHHNDVNVGQSNEYDNQGG